MLEGGRAKIGTGENGLGGSLRKKKKQNFLLFLQATKCGVAEVAPLCRAASGDKHAEVSMWGAAGCVPGSLISKNTLCLTRVQKEPVALLRVSPHFYSPFPESQSEGGGQRTPRASPGHLIPAGGCWVGICCNNSPGEVTPEKGTEQAQHWVKNRNSQSQSVWDLAVNWLLVLPHAWSCCCLHG